MPDKDNPNNSDSWLGGSQTMQEEDAGSSKAVFTGNTSGLGSKSIIPPEIKGWNWGAFFFGWLWGIPNNVWISLLSLIPYAGVIVNIVLGSMGNQLAWQHKEWDGIEHFKRTQKNWASWALGIFVLEIIIVLIIIVIPE